MPAKPAKEGFDPNGLVTSKQGAGDPDDEREPVTDDEDEQAEGSDEHSADDELSLDELTEQIQKSIAEELADDEDEPAEDDDEGGEVEQRLKKAEAELRAMKQERKKQAEVAARKEAGREILATVKEFKLSRPQLDRVVRWYQKNPDMEGVVPFREGAIRVLGLGDRTESHDSDGRNGGSPRDPRAHVLTRNGGGPAPRREPFKPVAAQGDYSSITSHLLQNPTVLRKLVR